MLSSSYVFSRRVYSLQPHRSCHISFFDRTLKRNTTHSPLLLNPLPRVFPPNLAVNMAKRKRSSAVETVNAPRTTIPIPPPIQPPTLEHRTSRRKAPQPPPAADVDPNPQTNKNIVDGSQALRASPDANGPDEKFDTAKVAPSKATTKTSSKRKVASAPASEPKPDLSDSPLSDLSESDVKPKPTLKTKPQAKQAQSKQADDDNLNPEADGLEEPDAEDLQEALSRPPPVNSSKLPLPWRGRLGYACLCTYLRAANPPVFSSRTCRIASILENRHPLKDSSQPAHPTKNRPDREQPADIARGQAYVESLGLANARDIVKMLRWNDRFGIRFLRLSSEMFPFASHEEYGYKLAPFAAETLAEAGRVAGEFGHRLTTHPGQFTQLGSPREKVVRDAFRDLEYHDELLSLLKLPEQANRDAVMIIHMGGTFGSKEETLQRFRTNYARLSPSIKNRLVLENDDVSWSVHDLLPVCEDLNIPMVLDFHHHNIIFDANELREGTEDLQALYPRIKATWTRKGITQKMHYSEPTPGAITGRQRRKHNPRVWTLPPCAEDMDLMIEAKDKEQAVFELMRTFKLPGFDLINDVVPYQRMDENKPWKPPPKKKQKTPKKKKAKTVVDDELDVAEESLEAEQPPEPEPQPPPVVPDEEVAMGGPDRRVYWPPGMEEWLRPKKREIKKKDPNAVTPAKKKVAVKEEEVVGELDREGAGQELEPAAKKAKKTAALAKKIATPAKTTPAKSGKKKKRAPVVKKEVLTPSTSTSESDAEDLDVSNEDEDKGEEEKEMVAPKPTRAKVQARNGTGTGTGVRRQSGRGAKRAVNYADGDGDGSE